MGMLRPTKTLLLKRWRLMAYIRVDDTVWVITMSATEACLPDIYCLEKKENLDHSCWAITWPCSVYTYIGSSGGSIYSCESSLSTLITCYRYSCCVYKIKGVGKISTCLPNIIISTQQQFIHLTNEKPKSQSEFHWVLSGISHKQEDNSNVIKPWWKH